MAASWIRRQEEIEGRRYSRSFCLLQAHFSILEPIVLVHSRNNHRAESDEESKRLDTQPIWYNHSDYRIEHILLPVCSIKISLVVREYWVFDLRLQHFEDRNSANTDIDPAQPPRIQPNDSFFFDVNLACLFFLVEATSFTLGFSPAVQSAALDLYSRRGERENEKLIGALNVINALCSQIAHTIEADIEDQMQPCAPPAFHEELLVDLNSVLDGANPSTDSSLVAI
ncbi:hypothetical protein PILCRDRAFT_10219 [Piloderma croceum F 1598]|uniref:Uncharacterized protein n=1 Tax=Piloderma croceum (strain F 1598) TaxID=765440 RepID=A0A0C3B0I3_PILCF|nr:hypothetical protein PILCRDRAFT_10219 [Piloderma croceum F 1598]